MNKIPKYSGRKPHLVNGFILAAIFVGMLKTATMIAAFLTLKIHIVWVALMVSTLIAEAISFWIFSSQLRLYSPLYKLFSPGSVLIPVLSVLLASGVTEFLLERLRYNQTMADINDQISVVQNIVFYGTLLLILCVLIAKKVLHKRQINLER